ncbi:hypothetical protein [Aliikangiella sp. G2MR2-5]|uniref:hypothetical protein n=1 Tax=Aliikangiella sp. G2MR2-5 TaxID=2788943 RepID=UPI0018AB6F53|nr:hypothetical protein [Aliikangiella sp. G2MR2-5]
MFKKARILKGLFTAVLCVALSSCGDFPDYRYDQSQEYCVLSFPFAGGIFDRKYVGYFNITSTLQYLDSDPMMSIFIGEPSHIELEPGSVHTVEIADKKYHPEFHRNYLQAELQYWGPAFTFNSEQTEEIYAALREGYDLTIYGRLEVGAQYETEIYNFFFDSDDAPFRACVNRLLSDEDIKTLIEQRASDNKQESEK